MCGLFSAFTIVSSVFAASGVTRCGCFGNSAIPIAPVLITDVCIVIGGVVSLCQLSTQQLNVRLATRLFVAGGCLFCLGLGIDSGAVDPFFGKMQWNGVFATRKFVELGTQMSGTTPNETIRFVNRYGRPITLLGPIVTRTWRVRSRMPVEIPAGEEIGIEFGFKIPKDEGLFAGSIVLYIDNGSTLAVAKVAGFRGRATYATLVDDRRLVLAPPGPSVAPSCTFRKRGSHPSETERYGDDVGIWLEYLGNEIIGF